jgi:putative transposase
MPLGLKRYHQSKQTHFITFTCYRRLRHLGTKTICDLFVAALERCRRKYGFRVFGYVLMPNHVHLLLSKPDRELLSTAIQSLKITTAMNSSNNRLMDGRRSPLWQKRYYDRNLSTHEELMEKLQYIHRNPIRAGLCARPEDWPWSSFLHYATGALGVVEIESEWTARLREKEPTS